MRFSRSIEGRGNRAVQAVSPVRISLYNWLVVVVVDVCVYTFRAGYYYKEVPGSAHCSQVTRAHTTHSTVAIVRVNIGRAQNSLDNLIVSLGISTWRLRTAVPRIGPPMHSKWKRLESSQW